MKSIKIHPYILLTLFILMICITACSKDATEKVNTEAETILKFTPKSSQLTTRSETSIENQIEHLNILVFEERGGNYHYLYRSTATKIEGTEKYNVTLRSTTISVKLLVIANHTDFSMLEPDTDTDTDARKKITSPFDENGLEYLPMFGESLLPELPAGETIELEEIPLLRSVAGIQVSLDDSKNWDHIFILKSIQAYRANNLIQIMYTTETLDEEAGDQEEKIKVKTTNIPVNATNTITTSSIIAEGNDTKKLTGLYIPESAGTTAADRQTEATCLIIGGIYLENNTGNTKETYYRVDFKNENETLFGQILRNHLYHILIENVTGPGTTHPEEADGNNIETTMYDWEDSDHKIEL